MDRITDEEKNKIPKYNDSVGIRATLNNFGISNDRIGYNENTKTVTIGGKDFMKPTYMDEDNGISYAPESDIRKNLVSFYQDSKNPIVRVSDSFSSVAGKYGLDASALTYGDGTVMIGGKPLNTLYIDNEGKAWAWQNDVYDSVKDYANSMGVESPNSLAEKYNNKYLDDVYDMLYDISDREEFSYDPEDDPVYLAYREKYIREGNRASRDAIGNYSALTGGYVNSAAVTAGALTNQYYSQQISDKIPELAQAAYDRYVNQYQTDLNVVSQLLSAYDKGFNNTMSANETTRKYANETAQSVAERDKSERESAWDDRERWQEYNTKENENYWTNVLNQQTQAENENVIQAGKQDIDQTSIFLEYYRRLLDADLKESEAKVYSAYY